MNKVKLNLNIDKLEITYQATQQVRDALAAIEDRKVINEIAFQRLLLNGSYMTGWFGQKLTTTAI